MYLWDAWRAKYDSMTFKDQVEFYSKDIDPKGMHKKCYTKAFVDLVVKALHNFPQYGVLELGGGNGDLALDVYRQIAHSTTHWKNYEMCKPFVDEPKHNKIGFMCYQAILLEDFPWLLPFHNYHSGKIVVLSHVLEHMKGDNIKALLNAMQYIDTILVEVPIPEEGPVEWAGYPGSHILEWNMQRLIGEFAGWGYNVKERGYDFNKWVWFEK